MEKIFSQIAQQLGVRDAQVKAATDLLDEGSTVPFIARYRKEVTGALDDTQLRTLEERLRYLRELEDRRQKILSSIEEQGKLSNELKSQILDADTKNRLEDLYLPYKPKRRTKAQIAREAGLEPLADLLSSEPNTDPENAAKQYVDEDKGVSDKKAALEGARFILMERFAEDPELVGKMRDFLWRDGILNVSVVDGKENEGAKFRDYFDHHEPLAKAPSHRVLAIFRGRTEGILNYRLGVVNEPEDRKTAHPCELMIAQHHQIQDKGRAADTWLKDVVRWTWRVKMLTQMETDLFSKIREKAEEDAINVFASNMKDLLLAAPAGPRPTLGLDPGLRTGVKVAVIDGTGRHVDHATIYPHAPQKQWQQSIAVLAALCKKHHIELISIGNGTASRETDKLVADLIKAFPDLKVTKIMVSEAGASVYSASEFAAKEFPDLDVTIRGAVSIARRLQDPLAELVKIEPKSIGVGQYQHDVSQTQLARTLNAVVEDCVNGVGVDINTASAPLLTKVSGLNQTIAQNIVEYRNQNGAFSNRSQLNKVTRLGAKTFEQAAGFLRVMNGDNPLDGSAVHPEAYNIVKKIAAENQRNIESVIGDAKFLRGLRPEDYQDENFGELTVKDIINELEKPGRDPRPEFRFAQFQEGVEEIKDLTPGMVLEGSVTNVTNFGAFVDIGVHQDGLVHISALSHSFVKDPREVVKAGDIVKVKVTEVDAARRRISLTMRLDDDITTVRAGESENQKHRSSGSSGKPKSGAGKPKSENKAMGSLGALLMEAQKKSRK